MLKECHVFEYVVQSVEELMGNQRESEYMGAYIHLTASRLMTRPDAFPLWGVLQEKRYLHWTSYDKDIYLFVTGVMLEKRFSGEWTLVPEDRVGRELYMMLDTVARELDILSPVSVFAKRLEKAGVKSQPDFINWLMKNEKGR